MLQNSYKYKKDYATNIRKKGHAPHINEDRYLKINILEPFYYLMRAEGCVHLLLLLTKYFSFYLHSTYVSVMSCIRYTVFNVRQSLFTYVDKFSIDKITCIHYSLKNSESIFWEAAFGMCHSTIEYFV